MPTDVLIINALDDELQAVLRLAGGMPSNWERKTDSSGFPFYVRSFSLPNGEQLHIAAAWSGAMGETAAVGRAHTLIEFLEPLALAMCGICAGRREDVFLGDVIVADRVFSYDHGKLVASNETGHRVEQIFHDIETYNLERAWAMNVPDFARIWRQPWHKDRPISLDTQRGWMLRCLCAREEDGTAPAPRLHPQRSIYCPDYERVVRSLLKRGLVSLKGGTVIMTDAGRELALNERELYIEGPPPDPPFRVHLGAIATGKTVRQDPDLFPWLAHFSRKVLGVEMEAAAIGWIAELSGIPSLIAKAVSDYGDEDKDDGFRAFAARASAEFLLEFLTQYPPRTLSRHRVLAALQASGHRIGALSYAAPRAHRPTSADSKNEETSNQPAARKDERDVLHHQTRGMVLAHVLTPSDKSDCKYDVFVYAKSHDDGDLSRVRSASFFFGKHWDDQVFAGTRDGNRLGVKTSAQAPFLCTCRIVFDDDQEVTLHRFIDFEMGDIISKLADSRQDTRPDPMSEFLDVSFLARGLECARAVVRLRVLYEDGAAANLGTGFFIAPGRILTAHHMFFREPGDSVPVAVEVWLNYELDRSGAISSPKSLNARPETIRGNAQYDWAVIDVDQPMPDASYLPIENVGRPAAIGDQVYIIQHPQGGPKKLSFARNEVTTVDESHIQYLTGTTAGSSGAPVFNNRWEVVALHHMWVFGPGDNPRMTRKEGVRIERIAASMRELGLLQGSSRRWPDLE